MYPWLLVTLLLADLHTTGEGSEERQPKTVRRAIADYAPKPAKNRLDQKCAAENGAGGIRMKFRELVIVAIVAIVAAMVTWSLLEFFGNRFPWETRMLAGVTLIVLLSFLPLASCFFLKQVMLNHADIRAFQGKVDACLKKLAVEFLAACQENPPSAQKIRALKKKFWRAHNLAWSLGFAVRPKVRDYAKGGR